LNDFGFIVQFRSVLLCQQEAESENKNGFTRILENFALVHATCQVALKEAEELISA